MKHNKKDAENYIAKNGLAGIEGFLKQKLDEWKNVEINIAVTGDTGTGKSSFINAIRGLRNGDEGAAKTGVIETTREAAVYSHPTENKIKFWDLPGIGSPNCPDLETYCERVSLEKYDTFLIFTACRFTENILNLIERIRSIEKSFFFVYNKIDQDIHFESSRKSFNEESALNDIRRDCGENLKGSIADEEHVFLISNFKREKWDFPRLTQAIVESLPLRQKERLTRSLNLLTSRFKHVVKQKVEILRGRIWMTAVFSGAGAAVPVPGLSAAIDLSLILKEVNFYKSQLGFPDKSSEEFSRLTPETRGKLLKFCLTSAVEIGRWLTAYAASSTAEEFARYIPLVGIFMAGSISFTSTYYFLDRWLNELEETALAILDETNSRVVDDMDFN